jgi:hypothetical protein
MPVAALQESAAAEIFMVTAAVSWAYTAFLDLAQGGASPALGLIAAGARLNVAFPVSAATVLCAALVASGLMAHPTSPEGSQP